MRRPGWRKERGTQLGARRNRTPVACRAASTRDLTFLVTVLSEVMVFIGLRLNELNALIGLQELHQLHQLHQLHRYICESTLICCRESRLQIWAGVASVRCTARHGGTHLGTTAGRCGPKSETRNPKQIQMPNGPRPRTASRVVVWVIPCLVLRVCFGLRVSDFGFPRSEWR